MIEEELDPIDLRPLHIRRFSWDILPCGSAQSIQAKMGLVPSTTEAAELEHVESHARMQMVSLIEPAITQFSRIVSEVLSKYIVDIASDAVKDAMNDEMSEKLIAQNAEMVRVGTLSICASLMDTGVIGYTKKVLGDDVEEPASE